VKGEWVGGGIRPDIVCESSSGIPGNIEADWFVGVALECLEEADTTVRQMNDMPGQFAVKLVGGLEDGTRTRRAVTTGVDRPG
jgi:hypothetical protein